jgi:hypothetical protein
MDCKSGFWREAVAARSTNFVQLETNRPFVADRSRAEDEASRDHPSLGEAQARYSGICCSGRSMAARPQPLS